MVFLVVYALCGLLLLCYRKWINVPMKQISKGATEYANGNLSYRIPVKSEDELGYLSQTLNYMADKINQNGEYQRQPVEIFVDKTFDRLPVFPYQPAN